MHLAGNLGSEGGALRYLQQATTTESEQELTQLMVDDLRNQLADANDPAMQQQLNQRATATVREILRADQAAKLWIGQIKAEMGELETAVKYFTTWESPDWKPTRDYSLARVYEQQGKTADAIRVYQESESPQRHGNLLRSRRLGKLMQEKTAQN